MLTELKFVRNAVAKKDFVPELCFFRICDNRVTGFNGELAISSPIAINLDIAPSAAHFMKAVNACDDAVTLKMQKDRLQVRSGNFKTFVGCINVNTVPTMVPAGRKVVLENSLVACFKTLEPFIGIDASRPWACGVLFKGQSAFATNNISIVEHWLGADLPLVNIPSDAVREVLSYGEEPEHLLISEDRISFMYSDGKWISCKLLALEWPAVERVFAATEVNAAPIPSEFFAGVTKLVKFGDELGRCYFKGGILSTSDKLDEEGAQVICAGAPDTGIYNLKMLQGLEGIAQTIDFEQYPKPALFFGDKVRGALVGYRG